MPAGEISISGQDAFTIVLSLLGSSVAAALIAGLMTRSAERKKQLREQMLDVADAFASSAMEALARIRDFKPTKPKDGGHRNELLHSDLGLRTDACAEANRAVDCLRPLKGRVHISFAAGSGSEKDVLNHASAVIFFAREMLEISEHFWKQCDEDPGERPAHEASAGEKYRVARENARSGVNHFCEIAGHQIRSP